jgi:hypothetical protein
MTGRVGASWPTHYLQAVASAWLNAAEAVGRLEIRDFEQRTHCFFPTQSCNAARPARRIPHRPRKSLR